MSYLDSIPLDNPRARGKNFTGNLKPMWGYRCEDLRVVCWMEDEEHVVKVVSLGNRREVYADNGLLREA